MFSFVFGLLGAALSLIGWFCFHSTVLVIIGTVLYFIETIIEWKSLNSGSKLVDLLIFGIGCIICCFIPSTPWYIGGMLALAIYGLIIGLISLIL